MDQSTLVNEQQIDAGTRFLREFQKYVPIQAAFWLKDSEESEPCLCVVSDQITDDNFDEGYGEVARITVANQDPWFDAFRVKLLRAYDPFVKAAADLQKRYPIRTPTRFPSQRFGGIMVDEIYFYPSPIPVPVQ